MVIKISIQIYKSSVNKMHMKLEIGVRKMVIKISIQIYKLSVKKKHLKMFSAKWWPYSSGLILLKVTIKYIFQNIFRKILIQLLSRMH